MKVPSLAMPARRDPLLRPRTFESINALLILQTGSRAGLQAPLQAGYYMIGRHKECQIRPKSRSVSRRHCLLSWDHGVLRVLDLDSTSGTRVNEEKVTPRGWVELIDGDVLRCGKLVFRVTLQGDPAKQSVEETAVGATAGGSMVRGDAWQEVDIADYLDSADEADRERRYGSIRTQHAESAHDVDQDSDTSDEFEMLDSELDDQSAISTSVSESNGAPSVVSQKPGAKRERDSTSASRPKPKRLSKVKRKKLNRSGAGVFASLGDPGRLKMFGAIMLIAITVGALTYSVYSYVSGPSVRVLNEID